MPKFKITISDTITYSRCAEIDIEADDEDQAEEIAHEVTMTHKYPPQCCGSDIVGDPIDWNEDEIDNTPWEVEVEQVCHNCGGSEWKDDPETDEMHCTSCSQTQ